MQEQVGAKRNGTPLRVGPPKVRAPKAGQWFEATPRSERLHHFDATTGLRLDDSTTPP
jgi:hypothetical protein